ncbi:NADP-dependent oxidoreductase [Rhizobium sp. TRM95796]|uniref:NADP-dependent oxidoreductase n=1 Tax=Rhizobium sp. TRM95796 TaxID=2979862 RepID=UPI0021E99D90|nr:NADP-dependent oxidoreductase [Rhizobium sp. TRM95796]MCV3764055.1 NADP-dependent oxidoreductase [Rhizobium sp. TRM95796]
MTITTMKAVRLHAFGGPDALRYEDAPLPALAAGEILVRVHAVGLNPPDWYLRDGYGALPPEWRPNPTFPLIPGSDVSGEVAAVAEDVTAFAVGDLVHAMVRFPASAFSGGAAYAQFVSAPASDFAPKPANIDHVHAAAAPMSLLTAWQFLIDLGHREANPFQDFPHSPPELDGKTVLINGAGGGVGHLAVQLAKWRGARIVAVASGRHERLMQDLRVDEFIDYTTSSLDRLAGDVDIVLDTVGGAGAGRFIPILKRGGMLMPVYPLGFDGADDAERAGITVSTTQVRSHGGQLAEAGRLLQDGTVRVVIDSLFPLADASRAHERAEKGGIQGKIVLTVD